MAALGTLPLRTPYPPERAALLPITDYNVVRGRYLGVVTLRDAAYPLPEFNPDLTNYVVRQIRILYRQLWPSHGQRFPQ